MRKSFLLLCLVGSLSASRLSAQNQTVNSGSATKAVDFSGAGCTFTWTNDKPSIGLPASGAGNIATFTASDPTASPIVATITVTPVPTVFAYIPNLVDNTVSVVNTVSGSVVATIPVGTNPTAVSVTPDGSKVYIANEASNNVSVINTASNTVTATIVVGGPARALVVNHAGTLVYVAAGSVIEVISTASNTVVGTVGAPAAPFDIVMDPTDAFTYTANYTSPGTVTQTDVIDNSTSFIIPAGNATAGVAITPDGGRVYAVNSQAASVTVIDVATEMVIATIPVGFNPEQAAVNPDGKTVYVTNSGDGTVSVINVLTNKVTGTIACGAGAFGVNISADGKVLYVAAADSLVAINTSTNTILSTTPVGQTPLAIGNFLTPPPACGGAAQTFTITVDPASNVNAAMATGYISSCAGAPSASPAIQQFKVNAKAATGDVTATAPAGFEVSLSLNNGYGSSVTLTPAGGVINNVPVYVRSAATAAPGMISGNVALTEGGVTQQTVAVSGLINPVATIDQVADQVVQNGASTTAVNFTGLGNTFTWINDLAGIGLAIDSSGNIPSFTAINTGNTPITATIAVTNRNAGYAYVGLSQSTTVTVINTATYKVLHSIGVGSYPYGIWQTPYGGLVYFANYGSNTVSVINTATQTVTGTIAVGKSPSALVGSADGATLYVVNQGNDNVSVVNTATQTVTTNIAVGQSPEAICMSLDGSTLYVTNQQSNSISVISTATNAVTATMAVGLYPEAICVSPDGTKLYEVNDGDNNLYVISTATNTVVNSIPVGAQPHNLTISGDGSTVYTVNQADNTISVVNTVSGTVTATIPVGAFPDGIALSPDGSTLWVTDLNASNVVCISTAADTVIATVPTGANPGALGNFVGNSGCPSKAMMFTIKINPTPNVSAGPVGGYITACAGSASAAPAVQQFSVSATAATGPVTAAAPTGFEVSLSLNSGYGSSVMLMPAAGVLHQPVYVRSAATAQPGNIGGNVVLTEGGVTEQMAAVTGLVNALPTLDQAPDQTVLNGAPTMAVTLMGAGNTITWTSNTPGIGLADSGSGNIPAFTAINSGNTPIVATISVTTQDAGYAYIGELQSNVVSVINTTTHAVVDSITVGSAPYGMWLTPDGKLLYTAIAGSSSLSVVNTATRAVVSSIPLANSPWCLVGSADGSTLYVTVSAGGKVDVVNTATGAVTATIQVGNGPQAIIMSPDGSKVYVVNTTSKTISVISTATNTVIATIATGDNPNGICLSPDGTTLYVSNSGDNNLYVISTATNTVTNQLPVPGAPHTVVMSADGSTIYTADQSSSMVSVINAATGQVTAMIPVGSLPEGMELSSDGSELYVTDGVSDNVLVISTATNQVRYTIPVAFEPGSLGNFISRAGCPSQPMTFTIKIIPTAPLIVATGTPAPMITVYGTPSAADTIMVSGSNLTAGIVITPPAGFEVSTDGATFSSTVTIGDGATVSSTIIYIRLAALSTVGTYKGNIVLGSDGATTQDLAIPASTVTPAPLTIIADDTTRPFGQANPAFTLTYSGFQNKETASALVAAPQGSTTATAASPAGDYPITVAGAEDSNYSFDYIPGTLKVTPVNMAVSIPSAFTPNGDGKNDTWGIRNLANHPNCLVTVFDRYGQAIFTATGYGEPWNGRRNGADVPAGTYVYSIDLRDGTKPMTGTVIVIR